MTHRKVAGRSEPRHPRAPRWPLSALGRGEFANHSCPEGGGMFTPGRAEAGSKRVAGETVCRAVVCVMMVKRMPGLAHWLFFLLNVL